MRNMLCLQQYEYDFAVDAGAAGAFNLHAKNNKAVIPVGAIITNVTAKVVTAVTADGSATLTWGNGDDGDGYCTHGSPIAVATFADNYVTNAASLDSALLFDGTNDHMIPYAVTTAAQGQLILTVAAANITAGKILFFVEYIYPTES